MIRILKLVSLTLLLMSAAAAAGAKTAGDRVDDSWIHTKVKSALVGLGTSNINVEVHHGLVQLAGFANSDEDRETAEKSALAVKGVRDVSNQIVVQTSTRSAGQTLDDGVVAGKVKTELADHETTSAFRINVEVRHGVVLLSGFVGTNAERNEALKVAAGVDGVIDVINGMDLAPVS
jgi:osmotically-inducible protein OsmY